MDLEIKKELTSNWFKSLQNSICYCINNFEFELTSLYYFKWNSRFNKPDLIV